MTPHAAFVVVYLLALIGVGALKARSIKTQEDFSLAGRGLPTWVLIGTLLATWIGTGSVFGNAEKTFRVGLGAFLLPIAGSLGVIALYFLAPRIRRFGQFTIQDILEARFGVYARVLGTITLLLAYVIIVSYQYRAGSAVVERCFDVDHTTAILLVAGFVIAYTALAGMFSVAYTDVANGVLMTIGVALALPYLYSSAGGMEGIKEALPTEQLTVFGHFNFVQLIGMLLPPFLLILGDANMVQRFFSANDPRSARRAAGGMFIGVAVLEVAIIATAFLALALVAQGKLERPVIGGEFADGHILVQAAFDALPTWLGAMLVGTIVAVVVSTADSYLLAPSTALVRDVYQRFSKSEPDQQRAVLAGRVFVVVLGLVALGLAFTSDEFFSIAIFAYTLYGAGLTPAILAAYFWPRATQAGAVSAMVSGLVVSTVWEFQLQAALIESWGAEHWVADVGAVLPAVFISTLVLIVVSLATPAPSQTQQEAF